MSPLLATASDTGLNLGAWLLFAVPAAAYYLSPLRHLAVSGVP